MRVYQEKIEEAIATLHQKTRDKQYDYGVMVTRSLNTIKWDITGMVRVAEQSHLLLTEAMAKLGDNIATTLKKVVGQLNKLEEQSDNHSDQVWSLEL